MACTTWILVLGSSLVAQPDGDELPDLVSRLAPSVVTIIASDLGGEAISVGTGFAVDPQRIITAWHVIGDAASVTVLLADGTSFCATSLVAADDDADVAVLEIDGRLAPLPLLDEPPRPGEPVLVLGSPLGIPQTVSDGIVSGVRPAFAGFGPVVQVTAPISHGNSGSPVLNHRGQVMGMACFKLTTGESLNFAIAATTLRNVLNRTGAARSLAPCDRAAAPRQSDLPGAFAIPAIEPPDTSDTAEAWFAKAYELQKAGHASLALAAYSRCAELDPDNAQVWNNLGMAWHALGEEESAAACLRHAIDLAPDSAGAWSNLGLVLFRMGRTGDARLACDRALALRPHLLEALLNRGRLARQEGRLGEARIDFEAAARAAPQDAEVHYLLAETLLEQGDRPGAWQQYEATRALDRALAERLLEAMLR